jgi:CubicO group peptidase (beta-lactamase class C family)
MKKVITLLLTLIGFFSANYGQTLQPEQIKEINVYIDNQIKEGAPGLAAGVILNGKIVYERYEGLASLQHQVPVNQGTRFNIASVAKQFTALCVLDLILAGKLSLEEDIRQYLPGFFPDIKEPILIRHLLNHSSGIRDFYDLLSIQQDPWWRKEGYDNDDAIALLKKQEDLNFSPGTDYLYSNSNYTLLTRIVAQVSGRPFHEYARDLFSRLGMPDTQYLRNYMHVIPNQAYPYSDWGNGIWQQYPMMTNLYGDGFLFTTLKDQLTFELAIQQAAAPSDPLLTISQEPIEKAEIQTYGYGLELEDRMGYPSVHHSGSTGSYHAQTVRYPEERLSIVVMSNNGTIWSGFIADKIASVLLPTKTVAENKDDGLEESKYSTEMKEVELEGEYLSTEDVIIRILQSDDGLLWKQDNNNPIALKKEAGSIYHFEQNPDVRIGFLADQFTVFYPGSEPRVHEKIPAFYPTRDYLQELVGQYYSKELDLTLEISLDEAGQLLLRNDRRKRLLPLEIIQRDRFLLNDYIILSDREASGHVVGLFLSINRVKGVRFRKR